MTTPSSPARKSSLMLYLLVALGSAAITVGVTIGVFYLAGWLALAPQNRQVAVHDMGSQVMPFDLDKTTHIFQMTVTGGVQQVIAQDAKDAAQIALIQQHLEHEALRFRAGDYSDPSSLHGAEMPGVKDLSAGAAGMTIEYIKLPNGAQLTFKTQDQNLVTALHQWFGAQLSDHGRDAITK
mgnify:FL=1